MIYVTNGSCKTKPKNDISFGSHNRQANREPLTDIDVWLVPLKGGGHAAGSHRVSGEDMMDRIDRGVRSSNRESGRLPEDAKGSGKVRHCAGCSMGEIGRTLLIWYPQKAPNGAL